MLSRSTGYHRLEPRFLLGKSLALATTLLLFFLLAAVPAQLSAWSINMGLVAMIAAALVWLASYANGYLSEIHVVDEREHHLVVLTLAV